MKYVKSFCSLLVVFVIVLSMAGCHQKDEIALELGEHKVTSALYMCFLIYADLEGRNKVNETADQTKEPDYYAEKIEEKDYVIWVKDRAEEMCREYIAYELLLKEGKYELTEEEKADAENYADYYWNQYQYSTLLEPNGVNYETFKKHSLYQYMSGAYFMSIYDESGTKPVDSSDKNAEMVKNFEAVRKIDGKYEEGAEDEQKAEIKSKLEDYYKKLTKPDATAATFEECYDEYNQMDHEGHDHDEKKVDENGKPNAPQDEYIDLVGAADTCYANENFDAIKKMQVGEVKLFELKNGAGYSLIVRQDITKDPYWPVVLNGDVLHILKDDEFKKDFSDYTATLKITVNNFAIGQFNVKNIKYPS